MTKEKKSSNKIISIIIIIFLVLTIPIGVLATIYYKVDSFRMLVNNHLKDAPGFVGEYFNSYPTEEEIEAKKTFLIEYFNEIDINNAADKLYIIKKDDNKLYNDIIRLMNNKYPNKTVDIIKLVRERELRKDLLFSLYDEIQKEKQDSIKKEAERLQKMDNYLVLKEIKEKINGDTDEQDKIADVINNMDDKKVVEILYYLSDEEKNLILSKISLIDKDKMYLLKSYLLEKEMKYEEFKDLAKIYAGKNSYDAFKVLGNTERYSISDLAKIYINLPLEKAADILKYSRDKEFVDELFYNIRREELLTSSKENITVKLSQIIDYIKEYEEKLNDLVLVYEKMDPRDVANIIEKLIINDKELTALKIDSINYYTVSDSKLAIDILRRLKKTTVSEILKNLNDRKATEITRKLALQ
ncbi:Flagellar motility protein MotE, a chaperone for MotC folding [Caloranaerobacter azorensis DSM 13643]|uniref:Flagellar motility protein MotE, a chaperone for MotC folding n=1 Tax=Caloranaerobacter azorensis DSM 13643 TaxID=1121264 RepID=A0A1M5RMC2_9FIRM|nr:hypothetical protein [Caloranaerobacter azorensis]SHH27385.1 Flagellar motility protein MotE, a chaperone for MotC folding [Caloranaerobacter azorensis DSM 13643]